MQWLPNHQQLFPILLSFLNTNGCLAIQMSMSWTADSHRLMRETHVDCGLPESLSIKISAALNQNRVSDAETYFNLLDPHTKQLDIWQTEYLHELSGSNPVFEWVKATGLRPILNSLNTEHLGLFVQLYKSRLQEAYPERENGQTLYPFRRLFIVATV
jgi:trans-aconitate 2-methyltransferase